MSVSEQAKPTQQRAGRELEEYMDAAMAYCGQLLAKGEKVDRPPILYLAYLGGTIRDLQRQLASLTGALADLVGIMPEIMCAEFGYPAKWYACCGAEPVDDNEGHRSNCPWLVAKKLLEGSK